MISNTTGLFIFKISKSNFNRLKFEKILRPIDRSIDFRPEMKSSSSSLSLVSIVFVYKMTLFMLHTKKFNRYHHQFNNIDRFETIINTGDKCCAVNNNIFGQNNKMDQKESISMKIRKKNNRQ